MGELDGVRAALRAGDGRAAIAEAAGLATNGRVREALHAYQGIGRVFPALRAQCAAASGELHAVLGDVDAAVRAYERALRHGAAAGWVAERIAHIRGAAATAPAIPSRRVSAHPRDAFTGRAVREQRQLAQQTGVLVLRPGRLAFVASPELEPDLRRLDPTALDRALPTMVTSTAGLLWSLGDARFRDEQLPLGRRLAFEAGADRILVVAWKSAVADPAFVRLSQDWPTLG